MMLFDKRAFSPSVVSNQSIQSQEMKMSEGVNMNSETSKLPPLPIIYCRFYKTGSDGAIRASWNNHR